MVPILVVLAIIGFLALDWVIQLVARNRAEARQAETLASPLLNHQYHWDVVVPAGYFVAPGHSWGRIEPDGTVTAGVDDFARQMLGTPDQVELPRVGATLKAGEPMATVYRQGRLAHIPAPVDGQVSDVHAEAILHPATLARDPYHDGWMVRLKPTNLGAALPFLRVAEDAARFQRDEVSKMRGFLENYPLAAVAADGGKPVEGIVAVLGLEAWEAFRRQFLRETI